MVHMQTLRKHYAQVAVDGDKRKHAICRTCGFLFGKRLGAKLATQHLKEHHPELYAEVRSAKAKAKSSTTVVNNEPQIAEGVAHPTAKLVRTTLMGFANFTLTR